MKPVHLLISSGNGPGECRQAVAHVLEHMRKEAEAASVQIDISEREAPHGPSSAIVILNGAGATALARAWVGAVLWRCQSALRPRHRRKNWFVQIFELEHQTNAISIDPSDVQMTAIRAGGPGGQHQNKTSSAIRARWASPDGHTYAVVVRNQRSQHQNRRIALDRLQELASADHREVEDARRGQAHHMHHQLERGNPRRTFEGPKFQEA